MNSSTEKAATTAWFICQSSCERRTSFYIASAFVSFDFFLHDCSVFIHFLCTLYTHTQRTHLHINQSHTPSHIQCPPQTLLYTLLSLLYEFSSSYFADCAFNFLVMASSCAVKWTIVERWLVSEWIDFVICENYSNDEWDKLLHKFNELAWTLVEQRIEWKRSNWIKENHKSCSFLSPSLSLSSAAIVNDLC